MRCEKCRLRIRGENHEGGDHHKNGTPVKSLKNAKANKMKGKPTNYTLHFRGAAFRAHMLSLRSIF